MIRTIHKAVTAAAYSEGLETVVTGGAAVNRIILRVFFETVATVDFRAYVDTDRIAEAAGELVAFDNQGLEILRPLAEGETLSVGWYNGSGSGVTQDIAVQVQED